MLERQESQYGTVVKCVRLRPKGCEFKFHPNMKFTATFSNLAERIVIKVKLRRRPHTLP